MRQHTLASPTWATSSFSDPPDTAPMEFASLGHHLNLCRGPRGRLFALRCAAEAAHTWASARLVTTLFGVAAVAALAYLVG